jgi:hypothetical protein
MKRALLVLALTSALIIGAIDTTPGGAARTRIACGVERWTVKTLQDRPSLLPVQTTTIRYLVTRPAPQTLPDARLAFERHVYTVTAAVTLVRPEDDGDLHLVLRDFDADSCRVGDVAGRGRMVGGAEGQRGDVVGVG